MPTIGLNNLKRATVLLRRCPLSLLILAEIEFEAMTFLLREMDHTSFLDVSLALLLQPQLD
jgi:hypothetical protein